RADGIGRWIFGHEHAVRVGVGELLPQAGVGPGPGVLLVADVALVGWRAGRAVEPVQMTDLRKPQTGRGCVHAVFGFADDREHLAALTHAIAVFHAAAAQRAHTRGTKDLRAAVGAVIDGVEEGRPDQARGAARKSEFRDLAGASNTEGPGRDVEVVACFGDVHAALAVES